MPPLNNREIPSFHAAALILGGAALASKLLGLLRDRLLAGRFGAGDTLDVYYAAFLIPDFFYTLLLIGAASAAVLPLYLEYERSGAGERFVSNLLTVVGTAAIAFAGLAAAFAPELVGVVAPGFGPEKLAEAARLTRIMMANVVFLGIAGILSSVLQARHRFFVFALPPIAYNLGIILGIVAFVPALGPIGLACGVILGGALQVAVQIPALRALRFRFAPRFDLGDRGLARVVKTSFPRVAALSLSQLTLVALTAIASSFAAGSVSVFKFAANLIYVPVGLVGVSYALAMFPKLSAVSIEGAGREFCDQVLLGLRNILFWALPSAAILIVLRAHVVRVVLGSGAFNWEDTRLVAAVLAVLAAAVVSESVLPLILRAFYAVGRTREPFLWDALGSLATVGIALGFSAWFAANPAALGRVAVVLRIGDLAAPRILAAAIGFALGSLLNSILLWGALKRVLRERFGVGLGIEFGPFASMLGAAVLAGLAAYGALLPFPALIATNTFAGILLQGAAAGVVGFAVYGAALAWQGNPEILGLIASVRGRLLSPEKTPAVYEAEKLDGDAGR